MAITDVAGLEEFLLREVPALRGDYRVEDAGQGWAVLRLTVGPHHLRPGPTVAGPHVFALADFAAWLAVQTLAGPLPMAVTTNATIDYLRMPGAADLTARAEVLKLGWSLAVIDLRISRADTGVLVARASMTYALPPGAKGSD
jgi:uncharacterized protein (TIGR00369 family)